MFSLFYFVTVGQVQTFLLEGGNPNARHHGKGLERATFCHGVELSYCLVTVRVLTETWYQECEQTLIILLLSI